jgi:hypothetical protein
MAEQPVEVVVLSVLVLALRVASAEAPPPWGSLSAGMMMYACVRVAGVYSVKL